MFDCSQFRTLIIEPVLSKLQVYSKDAEELLIFTCAATSSGGTFLQQSKGFGLGIYQMEPSNYTDIWINYIRSRNQLSTLMALHLNCNRIPDVERLIYDLHFATAMTRIHYLRCAAKLPDANNIDALWEFYDEWYINEKSKDKKEVAIKKYQEFIRS